MEEELQPINQEDRMEVLQQQRRARKRRRLISALITILAIALLTGAIILILDNSGSILPGLLDKHPAATEVTPTVQPADEEYSTVTIAAVGSICISDRLLVDARTSDGYDFSPCFFGVAKELSDADLTVGDLVCNFAGTPYGSATSSAVGPWREI